MLIERAIRLHPRVRDRLDEIASIAIETNREAMAKVSKSGPLRNPADRDHCMQYSVAVAMLNGALRAQDYEDAAAADSRIDRLRALMTASENAHYTALFDDPERRANPASNEVRFKDGGVEKTEVAYPAGHANRRNEGLPMVEAKFRVAGALRFEAAQQQRIAALALDHERLLRTPVHEFTDAFARADQRRHLWTEHAASHPLDIVATHRAASGCESRAYSHLEGGITMAGVRSSRSRCPALAVAVVALCAELSLAQAAEPSYPTKPVRWIVAFPPGGITDIMTRMLAGRLSENLGQQFIVDNRPGGGGLIAASMAARAAPDGYTLFTGTISTLAANVSTYRKLPYDPLKDFSPVTVTALTPYVLVINSGVPAHSVGEFVTLAKSKPKQLTFATAGLGGGSHLATELFLAMSGIQLIHVPYKGAAPAMIDLLAGQVHMNFNQPPSTLPHVASGRIRVLAASGARRVAMFPDVPTLAEAGVKGYEATSWQGLVVPAGTPKAVIARLHKEVDAVLRSSEMRERLAAQGSEAVPTTPQEFGKFIATEIAKWAGVAKQAGIKPE